MKIGQVSVKNFQSYRELDFDYADQGLALVSGDTGSGKSTFMDAAAWTIFGITSKDGASDDVRAWDGAGATTGTAQVTLADGRLIFVSRTRASGKNDLFFEVGASGVETRGKDLTDTQRLLEQTLGVTAELFLTGSYLTQFSKADSFFIAKAKDRRDVLEQIADQEFAIRLGEKASEARKVAKKEVEGLRIQEAKVAGALSTLTDNLGRAKASHRDWEGSHLLLLQTLATKLVAWDGARDAHIRALEAQSESFSQTKLEKGYELARKLESFDEDKARTVAELTAESVAWRLASDKAIAAAQQELDSLDVNSPDRDFASMLEELDSEIGALKRKKCTTCGGPHAGEALEKVRAERDAIANARRDNDQLLASRHRLEQSIKALKSALDPHLRGLLLAEAQVNPYGPQIEAAKSSVNPYGPQIEAAKTQVNPFRDQMTAAQLAVNPYVTAIKEAFERLADAHAKSEEAQKAIATKDADVSKLTWLHDKSFELRGLMMTRVVAQIESSTNAYLERFFDAALRVKFSLQDSDKLEVEITNNGFPAPFKALSGGERCMLKLCFSLSLMKAAQAKAGATFGMVLLDEPLNGLSDGLKVKAFGLLEQLAEEYPTVLVIDHSPALAAQFDKVYLVDKATGHSEVHEQQNQ